MLCNKPPQNLGADKTYFSHLLAKGGNKELKSGNRWHLLSSYYMPGAVNSLHALCTPHANTMWWVL